MGVLFIVAVRPGGDEGAGVASRIGLALAVVMNFSGQTTSIGLLLIAAHVALSVGSQQMNDSVTPR